MIFILSFYFSTINGLLFFLRCSLSSVFATTGCMSGQENFSDYSKAMAVNVKDPCVMSRIRKWITLNIIMKRSHTLRLGSTVRAQWLAHIRHVTCETSGCRERWWRKKITFGPRNDTFGLPYRYLILFLFIWQKRKQNIFFNECSLCFTHWYERIPFRKKKNHFGVSDTVSWDRPRSQRGAVVLI